MGRRLLRPGAVSTLAASSWRPRPCSLEARFEQVLKKGYAAVLPNNYEETTADAALTGAADPAA